nr:hypothetical protein [Rhodococcus sp. 06-1059B-a]
MCNNVIYENSGEFDTGTDYFDTGTDYDALSDWAENEMRLPKNSATARRGAHAVTAGKALLEGVGGRPSLDPNAAPGTVSPVR